MNYTPLPPIVHGPITPTTPSARVTAVATNATVDLFVGGASIGTSIGSAVSSNGGTLWVPITGTVVGGQTVTARQTTSGGTSDESSQPVVVVDVPKPSAPVFVSPLSVCMSNLLLDGLVPGATVVVRQGGSVVGKTVAQQTRDFVSIDASASLTAGARLEAKQEIVVSGKAKGCQEKRKGVRSHCLTTCCSERISANLAANQTRFYPRIKG